MLQRKRLKIYSIVENLYASTGPQIWLRLFSSHHMVENSVHSPGKQKVLKGGTILGT